MVPLCSSSGHALVEIFFNKHMLNYAANGNFKFICTLILGITEILVFCLHTTGTDRFNLKVLVTWSLL